MAVGSQPRGAQVEAFMYDARSGGWAVIGVAERSRMKYVVPMQHPLPAEWMRQTVGPARLRGKWGSPARRLGGF